MQQNIVIYIYWSLVLFVKRLLLFQMEENVGSTTPASVNLKGITKHIVIPLSNDF